MKWSLCISSMWRPIGTLNKHFLNFELSSDLHRHTDGEQVDLWQSRRSNAGVWEVNVAELDWLALLFYQSVNQRFDSGSFLRWPRGWWKHAVITRTHKQSVRLQYTSNNQSIIALHSSATGAGIFKELKKVKNSPDCSGVHLKNLEWWYWRASNTIEFGPRLPHWELHGPRTSLIFFFF